ncbi:uncharacterized protein [Leptinotarsa decemlineata]|uniref:uncharacterized protein n=1 Tax=Leptinotarsa decemlineata TaxID=7539 RepID=UPI003D305D1F
MEQVLNVFSSQLEIKDGEKKRRIEDLSQEGFTPEFEGIPNENGNENLRRSGRKRIRPAEVEKKQIISKPKRLHEDSSYEEIKKYYLDKKVKRLPPSLETIFEEPKTGGIIMSARKFKRCINFGSMNYLPTNKSKVKKRSLKAKKVTPRPKNKLTMDLLLKKLSCLEENELEHQQ